MPVLAHMHIPRPKSWDEFQDITLSALKIRWRSPNLQQIGRSGQSQDGVDVCGPDDLGRVVGVQCKLTMDELTLKEVEAEIAKAEAFEPTVKAYYIATTGERDAKIQSDVRLISEQRLASGKFPVGILFWEDLMQDLTEDRAAFNKHYPQITLEAAPIEGPQLLCALDVAFFGLNIIHFMDLIFGEMGQMANEDPANFERRIRGIEACARPLINADQHLALAKFCREVIEQCNRYEWNEAKSTARRIEGIVESLEYGFAGRMLAAYTLGKILNRWDMIAIQADGTVKNLEAIVAALRRVVSDHELEAQVQGIIDEYNATDSVAAYQLPWRAYSAIRRRFLADGMG